MKNKLPYDRLAAIYDTTVGGSFSVKMVDYTFGLLKKYRHYPKTILDLCCGTGTAAMIFADYGFNVTGLDRSQAMLKIAKQKTREKKLYINLVNQSLPNFKIIPKNKKELLSFDLITCYYDSLNYLLKESEIKKCFETVHKHLNPGGLFIFDMNTYHAFKTLWSKTEAGERNDIAWIFSTKINNKQKSADLTTTFFIKKAKLWDRFAELHHERAYTNTFLKKSLKQAGFEIGGFYKCFKFRKPDLKTNRIAVVAKKPK